MRRRRLAFALAAVAFASGVGAPASAQAGSTAVAQRAILVRGADPVKGLPFFPPNALTALVGAYRPADTTVGGAPVSAASTDETVLWFTREALVFGPSWKRTSLGGSEYFVLARPQGPVLALKRSGYYLLFAFPAGASAEDPSRLAFVRAFDRKFSGFMINATTDEELSFPAYVDY